LDVSLSRVEKVDIQTLGTTQRKRQRRSRQEYWSTHFWNGRYGVGLFSSRLGRGARQGSSKPERWLPLGVIKVSGPYLLYPFVSGCKTGTSLTTALWVFASSPDSFPTCAFLKFL